MHELALAAVVSAVTAAVYAVIGLRGRRGSRIHREAVALVDALDLDPYHVASLKNEATEAAAAELLLDRYVDVDAEGAVWLAGAGHEPDRAPAHPVPAALLAAVRRHDPVPVSLGWIERGDEAYREATAAHRAEQDARLPATPRIPQPADGCVRSCTSCTGLVLLLMVWVGAGIVVLAAHHQGVLEWGATVVTALCLAALWRAEAVAKGIRDRTAGKNPLDQRLREQTHPAQAALDGEQRRRLLLSKGDRTRWRGLDGGVDEDDGPDEWGGLDLEEHWDLGPDAYRYVAAADETAEAADEPLSPPGIPHPR
ncbi:hypothetical protein OG974_11435 [Streptomyces sp. NBC_00597]|uniref:hypothetical protein n=1 Tax=Streptomyces sp. NBC_00597 TaxID=2975786 RepID=UPI0030DEC438